MVKNGSVPYDFLEERKPLLNLQQEKSATSECLRGRIAGAISSQIQFWESANFQFQSAGGAMILRMETIKISV